MISLMPLRIIATGGTFDKFYDPIGGKLTFENSHLPEILQTARLYEPAELEVVTLIDSLDMGDEQRLAIVEACRKAPEQRIVIVHGTDTMMKTAELIGSSGLEKCVVLTGAMVPYSISRSDALFNLGSAVMATQLLPNGTWVAMNGRVLSWKDVKKDRERGMFVRIEPSK